MSLKKRGIQMQEVKKVITEVGTNEWQAAMLDRLQLSDAGIDNICEGLRQIAALPDPVGEMDEFRTRPNGLQIGKMRVPLGIIGII